MTAADTIYTPETLAAHFGYTVEAMRGIWRRCSSLDERAFDRKLVLDTGELTAILSEIAGSGRRTDEVRASARTLADELGVRIGQTSVREDDEADTAILHTFSELGGNGQSHGQADGQTQTGADTPSGQTDGHGHSADASPSARTDDADASPSARTDDADARTWEQKVADEVRARRFAQEEEAREKHEAEQAARQARAKRLRPYLNFLTIGLNAIEMLFIVVGLATLGGVLGFLVGLMVVLLGCYILVVISDPDSTEVGENAVWVWFVVCCITGYFIEWPAAQYYFASQYFRLPVELETYAAMIAVLVSGSSFVGTYLRWKKSVSES